MILDCPKVKLSNSTCKIYCHTLPIGPSRHFSLCMWKNSSLSLFLSLIYCSFPPPLVISLSSGRAVTAGVWPSAVCWRRKRAQMLQSSPWMSSVWSVASSALRSTVWLPHNRHVNNRCKDHNNYTFSFSPFDWFGNILDNIIMVVVTDFWLIFHQCFKGTQSVVVLCNMYSNFKWVSIFKLDQHMDSD